MRRWNSISLYAIVSVLLLTVFLCSFVRHNASASCNPRTVRSRTAIVYTDIWTDILYIHTGYDVIVITYVQQTGKWKWIQDNRATCIKQVQPDQNRINWPNFWGKIITIKTYNVCSNFQVECCAFRLAPPAGGLLIQSNVEIWTFVQSVNSQTFARS